DSHADLFMDQNGPVVRLVENTTLGLDKLNFTVTGVDTIIETQLDLKSGRIIGIVRKMADQSKYEIRTPNGVAGIRGTEYDITATSVLRVVSGSMVMVYVKSDGNVITQVVNSNEMFVPSDGTVKLIPADQLSQLVPEIRDMEGAAVRNLPFNLMAHNRAGRVRQRCPGPSHFPRLGISHQQAAVAPAHPDQRHALYHGR